MPWQNLAGIYCLLSRCLGRFGSAFNNCLSTCSVEFDGKVGTVMQELRENKVVLPSISLQTGQYWKPPFALFAVQLCVFLNRVWLRPTNISSLKWQGLLLSKDWFTKLIVRTFFERITNYFNDCCIFLVSVQLHSGHKVSSEIALPTYIPIPHLVFSCYKCAYFTARV